MRVALLAGASGLVGGHLLAQLLADPTWTSVVSVGRRELPAHPKLDQRTTQLPEVPELPPVDDVLIALGTTIKVAGSQEAFRVIDHDAVLAVAEAGRDAGARTVLHVSSMGADPRSRIFYNRVKGETERDVAAVGVPYVAALRPSIIDGDREESRPGERIALTAMRAAAPVLGRLRPTRASDIAAAMLRLAKAGDGPRVVDSREIRRLAR